MPNNQFSASLAKEQAPQISGLLEKVVLRWYLLQKANYLEFYHLKEIYWHNSNQKKKNV
jgi:hypothetical protein